MTHKDFVLIAGALARSSAPATVIAEMSATLANTNPAYDAGRFIAAAQGNPSNRRDQPA